MPEPPLAENGLVEPYDDQEIGDDTLLIRYIHPLHHIVLDGNTGQRRLSSAAFSPSSDGSGGMSVDLESRIVATGLDRLACLPSDEYGAVALQVGNIRRLGLKVGATPKPANEFHADVWHTRGSSIRRKIRDIAQWLKMPDGFENH